MNGKQMSEEQMIDALKASAQIINYGDIIEAKSQATVLLRIPLDRGLEGGCHVGDPPESFDKTKEVEWLMGQIVHVVESGEWFAMNSLLNQCLTVDRS